MAGRKFDAAYMGDTWQWDGGPAVTSNGFLYSRTSHTYAGTFSLKNVGSQPLTGPFSVVFLNLPSGVSLVAAAGVLHSDG